MHFLAIFGMNLDRIEGWIAAGGYAMLFGLLFACGLGLPLPEDIPLLLAGYSISQGKMHLVGVAIAAWFGIIGGDCMLYRFGRRYGMNITRVPLVGRHVTKERIEQAELLFAKYGIWVVALGRLIAGIRGAMVVAAGTIRYSFIKFLIADGLAAFISGGLWIWLGWWGGKKIGSPAEIAVWAEPYKHWIGVGFLLLIMVLFLYFRWRARRHQTIGGIIADKIESRVIRKDQEKES